MHQTLNLSHLTDDERHRIRDVLQKDFELRRLEKKRISEARDALSRESARIALLREKPNFNETSCLICLERFGLLFHRKRKCTKCNLNVCSACCQPMGAGPQRGLVCEVCSKHKAFQMLSSQWFYNSPQASDQLYGSSKVVRSLNWRSTSNKDVDGEKLDAARKVVELQFRSELDALAGELHLALAEENLNGGTQPSQEVLDAFQGHLAELIEQFIGRLLSLFKGGECTDADEGCRMMATKGVTKFVEDFLGGQLDLHALDVNNPSHQRPLQPGQHLSEDLLAHHLLTKLLEERADGPPRLLDNLTRQDLDKSEVGGQVSTAPQAASASGDITDNMTDSSRALVAASDKEMVQEEHLGVDSGGGGSGHVDNGGGGSGHVDSGGSGNCSQETTLGSQLADSELLMRSHGQCHFANSELENKHRESCDPYSTAGDNGVSNTGHGKQTKTEESHSVTELQELKDLSHRRTNLVATEIDESNFYEIDEQPILRDKLDPGDDNDEFQCRSFILDRIQSRTVQPEFSQLDSLSIVGPGETDPDMLSLNLGIIPEETEEELGQNELSRSMPNWMCQGSSFSPYESFGTTRMNCQTSMFSGMLWPEYSHNTFKLPKGDSDEVSEYSEDDEAAYYPHTSRELARIARQYRKADHSSLGYHSDDSSSASYTAARAKRLPGTNFNVSDSSEPTVEQTTEYVKLLNDLIPAEHDDPRFVQSPESVTIQEGEPVKFCCQVAGSGRIDVFWYREGRDVEELNESEDVEISDHGDQHSIAIYNVSRKMGGQYVCIAMNEQGKAIQYLVVTVKGNRKELKRPEFLKGVKDIQVTEGQSVKFRVKVKGYPAPRVTWFKDGERLRNSKSCRMEKLGNRDYILFLEHVSMDDDAEYSVTARNAAGEDSMAAQVIVDPTSDLPARKQNAWSTTASGVSDSDSDLSLSYPSLIRSARQAITPAASYQTQAALPTRRVLTRDAMDVLQIAEDIIQQEKHSSQHSTGHKQGEDEPVDQSNNPTDTQPGAAESLLSPKEQTSSQNCIRPQSRDNGVHGSCSQLDETLPGDPGNQASEGVFPASLTDPDLTKDLCLPSVDKLIYVFSSTRDDDDLGAGSFRRVHSITGRHVPRERLDKLRNSFQDLSSGTSSQASRSTPFTPEAKQADENTSQSTAVPPPRQTVPSPEPPPRQTVPSPEPPQRQTVPSPEPPPRQTVPSPEPPPRQTVPSPEPPPRQTVPSAKSKVSSNPEVKEIVSSRDGRHRHLDQNKDPVLVYPDHEPGHLIRHSSQLQQAPPGPTPKPRTANSQSGPDQQNISRHTPARRDKN